MHTKTWVTAGCQAETVGDGCLSQPFGFRLSDSAHYCHQAETLIWAMSRLISASLKVSLWEKRGASSLREDWIKMSSGADWARLHSLSRLQCFGANDGFQWRVGGPKHSADWLSQCLRKMSTLVCSPSFTDKVLCIMEIFLHIWELFYLAGCQHFHTHSNFSRGTHPNILFWSGFSLAQGFLAHLQSYSGIKSNPIKQQPETQPSSYKQGNGTLWRVFRFTCFKISTSSKSKRFPLD